MRIMRAHSETRQTSGQIVYGSLKVLTACCRIAGQHRLMEL